MIHYHGTPIDPQTVALAALAGRHAFISFASPEQLELVAEICQSFALDSGAYSVWRKNRSPMSVTQLDYFYQWVEANHKRPGFDFAVIPDIIDGSERDNDELVKCWPFSTFIGAPVWHLHEELERLERLVSAWPRVCLGSSGAYAKVGVKVWWDRMAQAMAVCCDSFGRPKARLHGLRMLNPEVFRYLPLHSADSCNIARNVGMDQKWSGSYAPSSKSARAQIIRDRIEAFNSAQHFVAPPSQDFVLGDE